MVPRGKSAVGLILNYLSFVLSGLFFGSFVLRKRSYDAIFVFAPSPILQAIPAIFLGWWKKIPVLLWVQDLWPESLSATGYVKNSVLLKLIEYVVKGIYRGVDLLLVQSRAFIPQVRHLAGKTPVVYYPNSFIEWSLDSAYQIDCVGLKSHFSVLFAGNIGNAQAINIILEAAETLKNVQDLSFVLVGDGSRREWVKNEIQSRGLKNIFLPGSYPVEAMPSIMEQASVLLVTLADTKIFRKTIPSKLQAYLAAGKPVLASLNGAGADLVLEAQAGLVAPAEDAGALVEAILRLKGMSQEDRDVLGKNGRAYFLKHFSHEKLVKDLIQHIQSTIDQPRKGVL